MKRRVGFTTGFAVLVGLWISPAMGDVHERRGEIELEVDGSSYEKRYVLRYPDDRAAWNGRLLIGANGGSGGDNYSRDGRVIGTDEVSLDDVIGDHAVAHGFAYASVDRDGIGGSVEGVVLTHAFAKQMKARVAESMERDVEKTYLSGLSMGGLIARLAAEDEVSSYDGILIIVGGGGDFPAQSARSKKMVALWPRLDELGARAYADAVGTPESAARFWPFMGRSSSARAGSSASEEQANTTGAVLSTLR